MNKTLIVSTLALGLGAFASTAQAQNFFGLFGGGPSAQEADWRGGEGWHNGRHGRGEGFGRGRHGRGGEGRREGGRRHGREIMRMLETFDANKDGSVSQAEIDQFRQGQITRFDTSKDGNLSIDEYQALWLEQVRERMVDLFQEHDNDGNGQVTAEEFNKRFSGLVERLDRNGDGNLSAEDMRRGRRGGERQDDPDGPPASDGDAPAPAPAPAPQP